MAYQRQEFIDHVEDENGDVLVEGTTVNKSIMEHIEEGIVANETAAANAAKAAEEAKTLAQTKGLPTVTAEDEGKLLQVVNGSWAVVGITDGNNVAY